MNANEFWERLEFRVCREFDGLSGDEFRGYWCDGFIPSQYLLDDPRPRITGKAWICRGSAQAEWDFSVLLLQAVRSCDDIDWASLLPPENMTRWMALDMDRQYIEIEPAVAVPDLDEPGSAR